MKKLLAAAALSCCALSANAIVCHSTPTSDDRGFYDSAVVSAATGLTWDGYNANIFAHNVIDYRRSAFATLDGIPASGPMSDAEGALYDAILVAASSHGVANLGNANGQHWIDGTLAAQWAHSLAWGTMYYRMTTRC